MDAALDLRRDNNALSVEYHGGIVDICVISRMGAWARVICLLLILRAVHTHVQLNSDICSGRYRSARKGLNQGIVALVVASGDIISYSWHSNSCLGKIQHTFRKDENIYSENIGAANYCEEST